MTEWEQVKVSDLEEGDTVRFAGLESDFGCAAFEPKEAE